MKAIKFIILGIGLIFASEAQAQISVNVAPQWGPSGYSNARYYYLPDVEAYYDIQKSSFVYPSGNTWLRSAQLPQRYSNYDLYNGYKVAMTDYNGKAPYGLFKYHKVKYAKGYKGKYQNTIGQKPGNRYGNYKNKGNGNGNQKSNGNGNGNGNGKKQ
ncbi:MAG: hypothetical protein ACYC01_11415 [Lutibacter sp.]